MKTSFYFLIVLIFLGCKTKKIVSDETLDEYAKELDKLHSEYEKNSFQVEFYDNGFAKRIGKINPDFLSNAARIGIWSEFYENGKLKETGEYKADSYVNCCIAGPCDIIYSYKIGEWKYYHENGQLKAKGIYRIDKKHIETTCEGGDEINIGFLNENWKFYDKNGTEIKLTEKEVKEIEESGIVDEFDVMGK